MSSSVTLTATRPRMSVAAAPQVTKSTALDDALAVAKEHRTRDTVMSLLTITANYATIGLAIAMSEIVAPRFTENVLALVLVRAVVVLAISSRLRGFENLVHEASHNNLFASPQTHAILEALYAFPVFRIVSDYRASHLVHHKHLGDPEKDPDIIRLYELGLHNIRDAPIYYLVGVPASGYLVYEYLTTTFADFWTSKSVRVSKSLYWATVLGLITWTNSWYFFAFYYAVPLFFVLSTTRYWAEASEHIGMDLNSSFASSRNNLGFLHRWFQHPHNDGYHAVHHLHAQVPFHKLPVVHELLMAQNPEYRNTTVESQGMWETFCQMATSKTIVKGRPTTGDWS
ncbi:uncharacterized protein yc1106_09422 [Curvularia clavata]|uniref:Fatty acid desaturase domain-containing protein n=1 Tax=Curvularia clavata TaxID=95742 RepID=A0A9Q9DVG7_CURCL|nr:uncharacterized protein yc1106_09422 [Curvularia clavata]